MSVVNEVTLLTIGMRRKEPLERIGLHSVQEGLTKVGRKVLEGGKGSRFHCEMQQQDLIYRNGGREFSDSGKILHVL